MNTGMMMATVVAALGAGVGGGFLAVHFANDDAAPTAPKAAVADADSDNEVVDSSSGELDKLRAKIALLETRLAKAEANDAAPDDELSAMKARIDKLEESPTATAADSGGGGETVVESSDLTEAVNKALEDRETKKKAERAKKKEAETKKYFERESKRLMGAMTKKLELSTWQQESITKIVASYHERQRETWDRGVEAKENGEEFDWEGEFETIEEEFMPLVEAELTASQIETFRAGIPEGEGLGEFGGGGWGK
ncbi:MAG: hypothetical protein ACYTDT_11240 [Planctomycetota bacterium]|jgi:hypothetical protein